MKACEEYIFVILILILEQQLEIASRLIGGGLNTRIYMVELGGLTPMIRR